MGSPRMIALTPQRGTLAAKGSHMKPTGNAYEFSVGNLTTGSRVLAVCKLSRTDGPQYLSCTYEEQIVGRVVSCGALSVEFCTDLGLADVARLVRWHSCDLTRGPMHYIENAGYWAETLIGCSPWTRGGVPVDPLEAFKSTVVFGAIEGETLPDLNPLPDEDPGDLDEATVIAIKRFHVGRTVRAWCKARFPALMSQFERDLRQFGLVA